MIVLFVGNGNFTKSSEIDFGDLKIIGLLNGMHNNNIILTKGADIHHLDRQRGADIHRQKHILRL